MVKKKIMVCDDDNSILDLLRMVLEMFGFEPITEINSLHVMATIAQTNPDLLLLDFWMPLFNGEQVLKLLKETPSTKDLPVIMFSASPEGKAMALREGASAFISKPFDVNQLLSTINKHLKN